MTPQLLDQTIKAANGNNDLTFVFIIAMFAWMVIKELLKYISKKEATRKQNPESEAKNDSRKKIDSMHKWTAQLHEWHNQKDKDGVPVWYVRSSFENAINRLTETLEKQIEVFTELIIEMKAKT